MNKIKWLILVLVILLIIIGTVTIFLLNNVKQNKNEDIIEQGDVGEVINYNQTSAEPVSNSRDFFTVNNCINVYLNNINKNNAAYYGMNENNEYAKIVSDEEIHQKIYNLLSKNYIEKNNITIENVANFVDNLEEQLIFTPLKMNVLNKQNIDIFSVYGIAYNLKNESTGEKYFVITLDKNNNAFSVEPINQEITDIEQINLTNEDNITIEANENNVFQYQTANYEYVIKQYISTFKRLATSNSDILYNMINEEYRNNKFNTIDLFKKYLENNKQEIQTANLQKYQVKDYDGYRQYVGIDQYNNYYIFNEKTIMDISIFLDTYTVDLPEFLEEYNISNDPDKAGMHLQKVVDALNNNDYTYVYNKLDATFRNNNFKTVTDFEKYIENTIGAYSYVEFSNYQSSNDLHVFDVTFSSESKQPVVKTFIVKLLEGTDFVMSFNV